MKKEQVLSRMKEDCLVAVVRAKNLEQGEKVVDAIIEGGINFIENTIMTKAELEKELEKVRNQGYALDAREMEEHMECAGAAIFEQDGNVLGAISVSSLYKPEEDYDALGRVVCKKAAEVSKLLGFLGKI